MLYSRLNSLTQMYTFRNSSSSSALHTASSGPTLLKFATDGASRILQLNMEPCPNDGDVSRSLPSLGRSYFERGLRFYKLFMLQSDLSVHEIILYTGLSEGSHLTEQRDAVKDIFWTTAYPRRRRVRTLGGIREMDDFLEPAGIEVLQRPTSKLPLQGTPRAQRKTINKTHRLVDQTLIYDLLTRMEFEQDASSTAVNIPIVVTQLKQLLAGQPDPAQLPLGTL
jgi:RNA polymerase I-specific transcription initiation factor RRN6